MSTKGRAVLIGGFLVAISYLLIMYLGIGYSNDNCDPDATSILFSRILCQDSNEIGDFLAGAFAPLAFVFLVVAVLLQTFELSAQREELELTRKQMKESTEALESQSFEAKKQAEFIGEQVSMINSEVENKTFEAMINQIGFRMRSNQRFANLFVRFKVNPSSQSVRTPIPNSHDRWNDFDDRLIYWVSFAIQQWFNTELDQVESYSIRDIDGFSSVFVAVDAALDFSFRLDSAGEARANAVGIADLWLEMNKLVDNSDNAKDTREAISSTVSAFDQLKNSRNS